MQSDTKWSLFRFESVTHVYNVKQLNLDSISVLLSELAFRYNWNIFQKMTWNYCFQNDINVTFKESLSLLHK